MVKFGKKWCFFLKLVSRGRLWSTGDGCFKPKIEEPLKTERNSGQFRFIEKMAHVRFIEQPKPKPAGVLSARRGLCSESGSTEQPTVGGMSYKIEIALKKNCEDMEQFFSNILFIANRTAKKKS